MRAELVAGLVLLMVNVSGFTAHLALRGGDPSTPARAVPKAPDDVPDPAPVVDPIAPNAVERQVAVERKADGNAKVAKRRVKKSSHRRGDRQRRGREAREKDSQVTEREREARWSVRNLFKHPQPRD